jgi:hypothetical protein
MTKIIVNSNPDRCTLMATTKVTPDKCYWCISRWCIDETGWGGVKDPSTDEQLIAELVKIANKTAKKEKSDVVFTAKDFTIKDLNTYNRLLDEAIYARVEADDAYLNDENENLELEQKAQGTEASLSSFFGARRMQKQLNIK